MSQSQQSLRCLWRNYFFHWTDKRSPPSRLTLLNRKNLYIFPNLNGAVCLLVTLVIWMLGTNYQNNLILAVSYLLVSLFIVAIYHTYANLAGLSIKFIEAQPAFAGNDIIFVVEVSSRHKAGCENLQLGWSANNLQTVHINPNLPQNCLLRLTSKERGYLKPDRLHLRSFFPLGIIHCWTWINLDALALVYPNPIATTEPKNQASDGHEEDGTSEQGGDDFSGLRDYKPGDSIKHIAWKQVAQEKGVFTKEYEANFTAEKWLDWNSLNLPQELRLSGLCYWALEYERRHIAYGLKLPGIQFEPNLGSYHLTQILEALAKFNLPKKIQAQ